MSVIALPPLDTPKAGQIEAGLAKFGSLNRRSLKTARIPDPDSISARRRLIFAPTSLGLCKKRQPALGRLLALSIQSDALN
jgi:hypothetical protein